MTRLVAANNGASFFFSQTQLVYCLSPSRYYKVNAWKILPHDDNLRVVMWARAS